MSERNYRIFEWLQSIFGDADEKRGF